MKNKNYSAHDIAISKQHKSVSASDVLKALEAIQFGDMVGELEDELKGRYINTIHLIHILKTLQT